MDRRDFLKTLGVMGAATLPLKGLRAEEPVADTELTGILVDTTRCVGCQTCEEACAEANNLPEPALEDPSANRQPDTNQFSVITLHDTDVGEVYVKKQCMHCNQPACASACLTKAMLKTEEGPVIWREDKCMGCRFCMISCPFDIPKFEYDSPVPKIRKCTMCWSRLKEGEQPACVENCPEEALTFGKRRDLIEEARVRIYNDPDSYVPHIYGEHEVGGTGYLYLSAVPFEQLGFRTDLGTTPYPEFSKDFLYAVPVILTLWPPFLLALNRATKKEEAEEIIESEV
jgi:Fe-S-cluster-containing dehydrogenase component